MWAKRLACSFNLQFDTQFTTEAFMTLDIQKEQNAARRIYCSVICFLFGHRSSNLKFGGAPSDSNQCSCGLPILPESRAETRIRHIPSCFLLGHNFTKIGERNGHYEYGCHSCGHPLLIEMERNSYQNLDSLHKKRPRYVCGFFGHKVHQVIERNGYTEYACDCGHSFLKAQKDMVEVKHPLICLFAGHFVRFVERRGNNPEYLCRNCGHTFYYPSSWALTGIAKIQCNFSSHQKTLFDSAIN